MGSGASSLDKLEREMITEKLRLFYDGQVSEGKSEVELNELMITKYNELVSLLPKFSDGLTATSSNNEDFKSSISVPAVNSKNPTKPAAFKSKFEPKNDASSTKKNSLDKRKTLDQSPLKKTDLNKGLLAYPSSSARQQGPSRRRSFAPPDTGGGGEKSNAPTRERLPSISEDGTTIPLKTLITSSSAAGVIETEKDSKAADSWESVVLQPSCTICGMFFQSEAKKERHIKYSDLHAKNLGLQQPQQAVKPVTNADDVSHQNSTMSDAADVGDASLGNVGELIYSGSKFFWRTRDDVDVHIYLHVRARALEVIPYDLHTGREMERIYLSKGILLSMIGHEALERKIEELKLKKSDQQEKTEEVAAANRDEEAKRLALSSHILSRLQISIIAGAKGVMFEASASDDSSMNPILKPPVPQLTPVLITRRRRTTAAEVVSTLDNLARANTALQAATGVAEKLLRK